MQQETIRTIVRWLCAVWIAAILSTTLLLGTYFNSLTPDTTIEVGPPEHLPEPPPQDWQRHSRPGNERNVMNKKEVHFV